ncbi:Nif3-like dinuclear metal center hexameric protein [Chryseobacterium sp. SNU WT5]|uniref:Nif3-like dinuclear metal center hexameric protein n=1 Tax=Chryseobacterium sp. SNU WT5 TaxID=2594269 RepID=UPI0011808DDB|nr:Nif3-like dinuclear metal center hexameric protein [Chryseobacterium sp. SNU WT5]QDP84051.1 Nif3-like dinuclear metal center hexameric protein [Chryseobacterium sp. SNU WT5]
MTVNQIICDLKTLIPLSQAEDYDNVGLLCGQADREVTGILVCHDVLEHVVDEAITKNLNFIVCFHPIIFSGLKSITGKNYVEKTILKAIENKIAIYAIHTAFDNDYLGVNFKICQVLGLINQKVLMPRMKSILQLQVFVPQNYAERVKTSLFEAGAGNIGFYDECSFSMLGTGTFRPLDGSNAFAGIINQRENTDEVIISVIFESFKKNHIIEAMKKAHPYEEVAYQIVQLENENQYLGLGRFGEFKEEMEEPEFLTFVKEKFNLKVIRHSDLLGKKIKKVGVLGGSGAGGIRAAISNQCDAYLTGDLKYHDYFQSEGKMLISDIGHFESEQFVTAHLVDILSQKFTTFAISKSTEKTNPVNYFL